MRFLNEQMRRSWRVSPGTRLVTGGGLAVPETPERRYAHPAAGGLLPPLTPPLCPQPRMRPQPPVPSRLTARGPLGCSGQVLGSQTRARMVASRWEVGSA